MSTRTFIAGHISPRLSIKVPVTDEDILLDAISKYGKWCRLHDDERMDDAWTRVCHLVYTFKRSDR